MDPQDLEKQGLEALSQNNESAQTETQAQGNEPTQAETQAQNNESATSIENMQTDDNSQAQNSLSDSEVAPSKVTNVAIDSDFSKKSTKIMVIFIIVLAVLIFGGLTTIFILSNIFNQKSAEPIVDIEQETEKYGISISGNGLNDFDLAFLKIENDDETNIVYSPLSIKYALTMLNDGVNGETKEQIAKVLGSYQAKSYQNSANLSIANALFVNNAKKEQMLPSYEESLKEYNASVVYDDFSTPDNMNTWISERTFGLINDLVENVDAKLDSFALANTLAIDMEWKNKIQPTREDVENKQTKYTQYSNGVFAYNVHFKYERVSKSVPVAESGSPTVNYAAVANRYDIINELGEENIRTEVQKEYNKWTQDAVSMCTAEEILSQTPNLDEYVNTLSQHYGHLSSSTDFYFHDDTNVTAFAKDLKTYDDTTLQYVAISPKDGNIAEYIKNMSAEDLNNVINKLKNAEDQDSYEEGYVTTINGNFDVYNFDYELKLLEDLKMLGIERVFDEKEAELDKISTEKSIYIKQALHKTNFAFSNNGIKAAAVTYLGGGMGNSGSCNFEYNFEVPKKEIEFNENKYLFLIRDKNSGEIWFIGLKNNNNISEEQNPSDV